MSKRLACIILGFLSSLGAIEVESYNFVLDPIERTLYYPLQQVIAPVVKIEKRVGDSFKKGELILETDPAKFRALVQKEQAQLEKALAELSLRERLYDDGNGSYFDYISAKAAVEDARAGLKISMKNLEATKIYGPYDGKVSALMIEKEAIPVESVAMIELVNENILVAKILIPSHLTDSIKVGDPITLNVYETGDEIQSKVSRISAVVDPMSSTLKIESEIDNSSQKLKSGMHGNAYLGGK